MTLKEWIDSIPKWVREAYDEDWAVADIVLKGYYESIDLTVVMQQVRNRLEEKWSKEIKECDNALL